MLQALLDELKPLPELEIVLPLDHRSQRFNLPEKCELVWVDHSAHLYDILTDLIARCDAIWPIAPETGGVLFDIARQAEDTQTKLLLSDSKTVAICADKLATCHLLAEAEVAVVESVSLVATDFSKSPFPSSVLKPIDGVGCEGSFIVNNAVEFTEALSQINKIERYLIQPYLLGDAISLSCLCKHGKGWLLSCNRQDMRIENNRFHLEGCLVNIDNPSCNFYKALVDRIAAVMPGLWGYIGIDIIETQDFGPLVMEINPRLTTSYAGLHEALGINVAEQILRMLDGEPELRPLTNQTIRVSVK